MELGWELWVGKVVLGWWGKWVWWRVGEVRFDWGVGGGGGDYDQPWGLYLGVLEIVSDKESEEKYMQVFFKIRFVIFGFGLDGTGKKRPKTRRLVGGL